MVGIPCVYAIARLTRRATSGSRSRQIRGWLWSSVISLAAMPVVLMVAGAIVTVPGNYPDDRIPGLTAGVYSALAASTVGVVTLVWAAFARAMHRR